MMAVGPTMFPVLRYKDAKAAVAQLKEAFGFTEHVLYEGEDGTVAHAELAYGEGMVMLGTANTQGPFGKAMADAGPTAVYVVIEDADAHCRQARAGGAEILAEPEDQDYGSRDYMARDLEGNIWCFGTYAPGAHG